MFWIGLGIGIILGANISLILYALIIVGKDADENLAHYLSSNF